MIYNKLVRDKMEEVILKKSGIVAKTRKADDSEFWEKLKNKLVEEATEFKESGDPSELNDIKDVIDEIIHFKNFDIMRMEKDRKENLKKHGGFQKRIILEEA